MCSFQPLTNVHLKGVIENAYFFEITDENDPKTLKGRPPLKRARVAAQSHHITAILFFLFYWNFASFHLIVFFFNIQVEIVFSSATFKWLNSQFTEIASHGSPDIWAENSGRAAQASGAGELEKSKKKKVLDDDL